MGSVLQHRLEARISPYSLAVLHQQHCNGHEPQCDEG